MEKTDSTPVTDEPTAGQPRSFGVSDPVRAIISRAVAAVMITAIVFELYAYLTKFTIRSIYVHTPWMNDPYDTFVTFAVFFVPLAFLVMLIRLPLCRHDQPLPVERARDLIRCGRLILIVVLATVIAEWVAVIVRSNRSAWGSTTPLAIGLLALVTIVTGVGTASLLAASRRVPRHIADPAAPDWLGDLLLTVRLKSGWLGPFARNADRLAVWLDNAVLAHIRRHPLLTSAVLSALFGLAFAVIQAVGEGIPFGQVFIFYLVVGGCTMYAFLVIGGRYLDLVGRAPRQGGLSHRIYDSIVMGCAALPAAVAFRFSVWGAIGLHGETLDQIWALFLAGFVLFFAVTFGIETVAERRRPPPRTPGCT